MCTLTTQVSPLIAKEDMKCYKLARKDSDFYTSLYWYQPFEKNKLLQTNLEVVTERNPPFSCLDTREHNFYYQEGYSYRKKLGTSRKIRAITSGFHSSLNIERITSKSFLLDDPKTVLFECLIPKGSEYYLGSEGLIASNQIIYIKEISKPYLKL